MKFLPLLCLLLLALPGTARKITLEDVVSNKLVSIDQVQRSFSKTNSLLEKIKQENNHWLYRIVDPKTDIKIAGYSSADVLLALQSLPGMADLTIEEIGRFQIDENKATSLFYIANDLFTYNLLTKTAQRITNTPHEKVGYEFSPDAKFVSYIENYNLWLVDLSNNIPRQLTFDGNSKLLYGRLDWVYQEEIFGRGNYGAYWWSPDSLKIAFLRIDESPVKDFPIVDDLQLYGNPRLMSYPKAGHPNPIVDIGVINARGGEITWVDLDEYKLNTPLIVGVGFDKASSNLIYQVQDRIQSWLHIRSHNVQNKKSTTLWTEKSDTWTNRLQENPHFVEEGFYFLSEIQGYSHIYFHKYSSQEEWNVPNVAQPKTTGFWDVKKILRVLDDKIYFSANRDSLLSEQIYMLNLKDLSISCLTDKSLHHDAIFSPDGNYAIINSQSYQTAPKKYLHEVKGDKLLKSKVLFESDISELSQLDMPTTSYFTIDNRDNRELQAMLVKPANFDESKKYPVLTHVYCGPKLPRVLNRFNVAHKMWHNYLAQEDYVVFILDCYSSNSYGHVGEANVYKKLGVKELEDIEDGVNYLKTQKWVDQDRLAIWGWSYGGYMTSYAMTRTNMFKMGISVAPPVDWTLYDSVYTERYMCTPQDNKEGYRCSSVLENAADLNGELLLIHGTMDDNVHPQNVHKLVHALQSYQKTNFQQIFYPDNEHSILTMRPHLFAAMDKFIRNNL